VYGAGIYSNITQEDKSLGVLTLMAREFSRNKADNPSSTVKPGKKMGSILAYTFKETKGDEK
jgi:hypothetical protein